MASSLKDRRLTEDPMHGALKWALKLKQLLQASKVNIVTAESLTAGMILKTLVDIPMEGNTIYGGFGVYDTDAKRLWLNVKTRGVYGDKTAIQMAEGALANSRATISLAVTGDAMPYPEDKNRLGEVYIGVSIRTPSGPETHTMKLESCKEITAMCDAWKSLQGGGKYAPIQMTAMIADYIRLTTTKVALKFCYGIVKGYDFKTRRGIVNDQPWDEDCMPSGFIDISLRESMIGQNEKREKKGEKVVGWCDAEDMDDLPSMSKMRKYK